MKNPPTSKFHYDMLGLKFSNIGEYTSQLIMKKIPLCTVYDFFSTDGLTHLFMTLRVGRYEKFKGEKIIQEINVHVELHEEPDSTFFEYYKIHGLYEFYLFMNHINKKHGIINKNRLNIYDIKDLLEEIILTKS